MSAASAGEVSHTAADGGTLSNHGKVQIKFNDKGSYPENRRIAAVAGHLPLDSPYWVTQTLDNHDRRSMAPFTLRFTAFDRSDGGFIHQQDEVRRAIWRAVGHEMKRRDTSGSLPTVLIETGWFEAGEERPLRIDVIFESSKLRKIMTNCMRKIEIQQDGELDWIINLKVYSNSLPGDVLAFDLLRLPLATDNSDATMKCLNTMVKSVGHVIGIGKLEYTTSIDDFSHGPSQVARGYIKLSPGSMTISFATLARSIPTHFVWDQIPYVLRYPGRDLHDEAVYSANFPIEEAESNDEANSPTSSSSATGSGSTTLVESSSDESNKRKRSRK